MSSPRRLMHEDDVELTFGVDQLARLETLRQANAVATTLVDQARADGRDDLLFHVIVGHVREDITIKQRKFLHHAVLPQIAEKYTFPDGTRFAMPIWKEHYRERFLGHRWEMRRIPRWDAETGAMVLPKRATPHRVRISTEDLDVKLYSEYIDRVIDTAVLELGVTFEFRTAERNAVRYREPARKHAAAPKREREAEPA